MNLPFTALLGGVVIYWTLVALGLLSWDSGPDASLEGGGDLAHDVHADAHAHAPAQGEAGTGADAHGDAHAGDHGDGGADHGSGVVAGLMRFLHLGEMPLMIVLSVQVLCLWFFAMIANHYWTEGSVMWAALFTVPNVLLSLVVTRYVTWPLAKFFRALNREYDEHLPLTGRTCVIESGEANATFGQARIHTRGAPVVINVRTSDGEALRKGDTALVVREDKARRVFFVVKVTDDKLEI
ncbi:MAG: hypothetical protein ACYDC1_06585 [Limisphaerales bacterium]